MRKALYIGIFDPVTLGHLDILERSSKLVDKLIIGVFENPSISTELTCKDRIRLTKKAVSNLKNVEVVIYDGYLDKMLEKYDINLFIRGLRMMSDFENELNFVHTNNQLNSGVDTLFLATNEIYANFSSREVRQIARNHGKVEQFLPISIIDDVKSIYA